MSAPLAGKFQDHYIVLEVEPRSETDVIQQAYQKGVQLYHPKTGSEPSQEKFDAVNLAYEVLSDPGLRAEFDKLKGHNQTENAPRFSGQMFFDSLGSDVHLRITLLCVLYDRRRNRPFTPSLSMRHIEGIVESTTPQLTLALWYLKQRGLVQSDDKSSLQITADGMDFLEKNPPDPANILRFIRAHDGSTGEAPGQTPTASAADEPATEDAVEAAALKQLFGDEQQPDADQELDAKPAEPVLMLKRHPSIIGALDRARAAANAAKPVR
jgi:curved DNA-binding protein CbpA